MHAPNNRASTPRSTDGRPLSRPRPLSLDKPLPQLAKEDGIAYSLFIEGVTLLAWDVAWLCRTQGINVGAQSWDEICSIGKNLWQLLVSTPTNLLPPMTGHRPSSNNLISTNSNINNTNTNNNNRYNPGQQGNEGVRTISIEGANTARREVPQQPSSSSSRTQILGHYSHGTAHSFLGGAEGTEFMRGWKLQGPMKMVDHLKSVLLGEMTGAEWEVVDEKEWIVDDEDRGTDHRRTMHEENGEGDDKNNENAEVVMVEGGLLGDRPGYRPSYLRTKSTVSTTTAAALAVPTSTSTSTSSSQVSRTGAGAGAGATPARGVDVGSSGDEKSTNTTFGKTTSNNRDDPIPAAATMMRKTRSTDSGKDGITPSRPRRPFSPRSSPSSPLIPSSAGRYSPSSPLSNKPAFSPTRSPSSRSSPSSPTAVASPPPPSEKQQQRRRLEQFEEQQLEPRRKQQEEPEEDVRGKEEQEPREQGYRTERSGTSGWMKLRSRS